MILAEPPLDEDLPPAKTPAVVEQALPPSNPPVVDQGSSAKIPVVDDQTLPPYKTPVVVDQALPPSNPAVVDHGSSAKIPVVDDQALPPSKTPVVVDQALPPSTTPVVVDQTLPPSNSTNGGDQASDGSVMTAPVAYGQSAGGAQPDPNRLWFSVDYLMWWFKSAPVPVLVTSAPGNSTSAIPGLLGNADTTVELGGSPVASGIHSGARFAAGYWFGCDQISGVEGNYFFLARRAVNQSVSSSGEPGSRILGYSFFNAILKEEDVSPTGTPLLPAAGFHNLATTSQLNSAEISGALNLANTATYRLDILAGARYTQLDEGLRFVGSTFGLPGSGFDGQTITTVDQFYTHNQFWGGQLGARGEYRWGKWAVNATAKVALGNMNQTANIHGFTTATGPGVLPATGPGGFFALSTNSGHFSQDHFAVIPEANFNVGYQLTSWARLQVGYSFLYLSSVARPGDQLDRSVNTTQLPAFGGSAKDLVGPARPAFDFHDSGFWAQGINFGVVFRY
jgi:hypothetical protein